MIVAVLFAVTHICDRPALKPEPALQSLAPTDVCGWKAAPADGLYTAQTLHEYIDGASEIYKALNVKSAMARRYEKPAEPSITADIFEMDTPADAFGAYHHDIRDAKSASIGRESEYDGSTLAFWKGPYVVYVAAPTAPDPVRAAILSLGRAIADAIDDETGPPDILNLLPVKDRIPGQVRYFHNHFLLNLYYYVSDDNLLSLGPDTEGVLGWYKTAENPRMTCAVIRYPSKPAARAAHKAFMSGYLPDADSAGTAQTENNRWAGARLAKNIMRLVFDAPTRADATKALEKGEGEG